MSTIRWEESDPAKGYVPQNNSGANAVFPMRRLSKAQSFDKKSMTSSYDADDDEDPGEHYSPRIKSKMTDPG